MKIALILTCLVGYLFSTRALDATIRKLGARKRVLASRVQYLARTANISLFVLFVILVCVIMGIGYGEISLFVSSVFAVIGVALFAQWSILSNITASMIIFFGFPYRVGDRIKVTDADFDISGRVEEISLFHVLIRTEAGNVITYPNNLILQKPVIKLDRGNTRFPQKVPPSTPDPSRPQWRARLPARGRQS